MCATCQAGYALYSDSKCVLCTNNQYVDIEKCSECDPGCDGCSGADNTKCIACNEGFYMNNDEGVGQLTCSTCIANCQVCDTGDVCNVCQNGYVGNETSSCKVDYGGFCDTETI